MKAMAWHNVSELAKSTPITVQQPTKTAAKKAAKKAITTTKEKPVTEEVVTLSKEYFQQLLDAAVAQGREQGKADAATEAKVAATEVKATKVVSKNLEDRVNGAWSNRGCKLLSVGTEKALLFTGKVAGHIEVKTVPVTAKVVGVTGEVVCDKAEKAMGWTKDMFGNLRAWGVDNDPSNPKADAAATTTATTTATATGTVTVEENGKKVTMTVDTYKQLKAAGLL